MNIKRFLKSIGLSLLSAFRENEEIVKFKSKNPKFVTFLKNRLSRSSFWGMPATLLGGAFLYVLFLFFGVAEDFVTAAPIVSVDERFNQLMLLFRSGYFIKFFLFITSFARWQTAISLFTVLTIIFLLHKKTAYILPAWLTLGLASLLNSLGKLSFHRARPTFPIYLETTYSFPSGHATTAVVVYGFIAYFLWKKTSKKFSRITYLLVSLIIIIFIGFSRLYLGVHYLSDVWSGYLLGLLCLILGISLTEWQLAKIPNQKTEIRAGRQQKIISSLLLFGELILCIYLAYTYRPARIILADSAPIEISNPLTLSASFNLPRTTETISASRQEPLSFITASQNDASFISQMKTAGWALADSIDSKSLIKIAQAFWANQSYPNAPMTPSFWNGETNDFGFEKSTEKNTARERHHARFWKTNLKTANGDAIYVGTVSLDIGLKWAVTHQIAPDIDTDREQLFQDLQKSGVIKEFKKSFFVKPTLGKNFTGDEFFTDGNLYSVILK